MKNKLLTFTLTAMFLKFAFAPQIALSQNTRVWGTYYGGNGVDYSSSGGEFGNASSVATDAAGNVYMAGSTTSPNNMAFGGFQNTWAALQYSNAFLVKFDANGNRLWATYYGGTISTSGSGVATDAAGNVYLAGNTQDTSGIASGGFQNKYGGGSQNAYLVKFDQDGNRIWATYYGGAIGTGGVWSVGVAKVATDALGNVYLAGGTQDTAGIASGGFQNNFIGTGGFFGGDAFLVKFDANGNRIWGTYYGAGNTGAASVATDGTGNVYIAGTTIDLTNIAWHGFQNTFQNGGGEGAAFLAKFDANGNRIWGTYYGDLDATTNAGACVAADVDGNIYLAGSTSSTTGIASGGFQNSYGTSWHDAFLVKFDGDCHRLWATYYGGAGKPSAAAGNNTEASSVVTDAKGNVWLAGLTVDSDSIAFGGFQNTYFTSNGYYQQSKEFTIFLVKFDANGIRQCATYCGQSVGGSYSTGGVALDNAGNIYVGGDTNDSSSALISGAFQNFYGGGANDAFLVKITSCSYAPPVANFQSSATTICANECINYTDLSTNANSWLWSFPGGSPSSSTIQNPQYICYYNPGTFNASLIVSNNVGGTDTLSFINHISVFPIPPTPVITISHDTLFCSTDPTYTFYQWYDSTAIIPGGTDTLLVITHGGNYNVKVANEFGCQISVGINTPHNVGFNEFSADNSISIFPNPASTQLTIHTSSSRFSGRTIISIMNVLSQELLSYSLALGEGRGEALDITTIPPGMYFLQLKTENETVIKRFVKQ